MKLIHQIILFLIIFAIVGFLFPWPSHALDLDNDLDADFLDLKQLVSGYNSPFSTLDHNRNGVIDLIDFNFFLTSLFTVVTPTPNPQPSPSTPHKGIWISPEEVKALPIAGQSGCTQNTLCYHAWNELVKIATSSWNTPNLSDYDGLSHSQQIFAGALVTIRCEGEVCPSINAASLRAKVISGLDAVVGTEQTALNTPVSGELLAPTRQITRYILVADLLGINDWKPGYRGAKNYVDYIANAEFTYAAGDNGDKTKTFAQEHEYAASNGNTMAGTARIAAAAYLGNKTDLDKAWLTFRRYVGDHTVGPALYINSDGQTWFHVAYDRDTNAIGINPPHSVCHGTTFNADGAIPADQGRGSTCPSGPTLAPGYTQYPWEGLQGIYAQAEMLKRLGYNYNGQNPYQIQNQALLRAIKYQWYLQENYPEKGAWYDADRAAWVKHLAKKNYGFDPLPLQTNGLTYDAVDGARNVGYTQWTHQ